MDRLLSLATAAAIILMLTNAIGGRRHWGARNNTSDEQHEGRDNRDRADENTPAILGLVAGFVGFILLVILITFILVNRRVVKIDASHRQEAGADSNVDTTQSLPTNFYSYYVGFPLLQLANLFRVERSQRACDPPRYPGESPDTKPTPPPPYPDDDGMVNIPLDDPPAYPASQYALKSDQGKMFFVVPKDEDKITPPSPANERKWGDKQSTTSLHM